MSSGRPRHAVWAHFDRVKDDAGHFQAKCRGCGKDMVGLVQRMAAHLSACPGSPANSDDVNDTPDSSFPSSSSQSTCIPGSEPPKKKACRQSTLAVVRTNQDLKGQLDVAVARAVMGCNLSFRSVENDNFLRMVSQLRPGYSPPNRKQLATMETCVCCVCSRVPGSSFGRGV